MATPNAVVLYLSILMRQRQQKSIKFIMFKAKVINYTYKVYLSKKTTNSDFLLSICCLYYHLQYHYYYYFYLKLNAF